MYQILNNVLPSVRIIFFFLSLSSMFVVITLANTMPFECLHTEAAYSFPICVFYSDRLSVSYRCMCSAKEHDNKNLKSKERVCVCKTRERRRENKATNYTYCRWWYAYEYTCVRWSKLLFTVDKRKEEKKSCIVASFVVLIHAKNVKDQETHSLSFYSLHLYIYIFIFCCCIEMSTTMATRWCRGWRKRKLQHKKNEGKKQDKKEKHVGVGDSSTNMSDPSQFETDMLIVPIIVLSRRWHLGIFSFQKSATNDHHHQNNNNNNNNPTSSSTAVTSSTSSSRLQSSKMRSDPNEPHIGKYRFSKVNNCFCIHHKQHPTFRPLVKVILPKSNWLDIFPRVEKLRSKSSIKLN